MQDVVWYVSIVLMAIVVGMFIRVADSADRPVADYGPLTAAAYRLRPWLFLIVALAMVALNWRTFLGHVVDQKRPHGWIPPGPR